MLFDEFSSAAVKTAASWLLILASEKKGSVAAIFIPKDSCC
jgi:hypothetical protein